MATNDNKKNDGLFKNIIDIYDRDLRGASSPFRNEIQDPNSTAYKIKEKTSGIFSRDNNKFKLNSYQWYTSDLRRWFKEDYFNNIKVDNYQEPAKGDFVTRSLSPLKDNVTNYVNNISSTYNAAEKGVKNILNPTNVQTDNTDALDESFTNFLNSFPIVKIYEFKPQDTLSTNLTILSSIFNLIDEFINSKDSFVNKTLDVVDGFFDFFAKKGYDLRNRSTFSDPIKRIYSFPNLFYRNLISGYYTGYYEIPVLNYDDFLESKGSNGWSQQGLISRVFGDTIGSTVENFSKNVLGSGLNIATRPRWTIESGGDGRDNISLDLMLYNDNFKSFTENLTFINSFVAGNLWYQDTIIQKCPSLYDIEIPGRFRYYFCTADIKVSYKGKVRKFVIDDSKIQELKNNIPEIMSWNIEVFNNIPDVFEVSIKFNSLIPNNYNTYFSYLLNNEENKANVGSNVKNIYTQVFDSMQAKILKQPTNPEVPVNLDAQRAGDYVQ